MGIFDGLMGNASEMNTTQAQKDVEHILAPNETVKNAFKVVRDLFIFTNKRLILIDKQGVTGKRTEYLSIPYKSIVSFSVETVGTFDLDAELKIWISGQNMPLQKKFTKSSNIYKLQSTLAEYVLG